jgi:hypothetical protein
VAEADASSNLLAPDASVLYQWADASYGGGDGRFVIAGYVASESRLYVFRSMGNGDRAPPM